VSHDQQDLSRYELEALVEQLRAMVKLLEQQNAELTRQVAALQKNSSNSSKPPSSDIVKPPKPSNGKQAKRKRGG
jgi:hypothetical protein